MNLKKKRITMVYKKIMYDKAKTNIKIMCGEMEDFS